jgi:hypothetical protein
MLTTAQPAIDERLFRFHAGQLFKLFNGWLASPRHTDCQPSLVALVATNYLYVAPYCIKEHGRCKEKNGLSYKLDYILAKDERGVFPSRQADW